MEFRILGPLEILDGERVVPLGGLKRRAVVAALLLHPNRVVATERLVDLVWGDEAPAAAVGSLQNHVLRLRRELGDRIATQPPGYLIRVEPGEIDLDRFRSLVEEARAREPDAAVALLDEALALWRGQPLADLAAEPVGAAAAHLAELRIEALESRIDGGLALGRHTTLVPELEALVAEHPFRERLRWQLMLALYRSGRQADALAAYAAARTALVQELGAEPGPHLQELQLAILRQDAGLAGPDGIHGVEPAERVEETRKTVTILVAELDASTDDPEARRDHLRRRKEEAAGSIAAHGGEAGRTADSRVLGIFGVPVAREDDALRAVRAAWELRTTGLVSRAVVATGDVITGDPTKGRPRVSGPPLEEADRLLGDAAETEVLLGERAWRLVRHAATTERRKIGHAVTEVLEEAEPVIRRLETPLVGREDELSDITTAFRRATREGRARLVTVFGSPGVGKTRLARETIDVLSAEATCLVGRTPAHGNAPTFAPLRDAFSTLAGGGVAAWADTVLTGERDGEAVAATIAAAAGEAPSTAPVDETAWATRRLLETLARAQPLVLVLEDLHWASPAFLDLVEHVAELAQGPLLLLALARPELLDTRPDWAAGRLSASSILLDPLPQDHARSLLDRLAGEGMLADDTRTAILDTAAGNPLFLEQLLAAAIEDGQAVVPDSIHTLLAARLDRLPAGDREVVQAAAVVGSTFAADVLGELVGRDVHPALRALARRDLVEPDAPGAFGEERWSFRHVLVRDEAYDGLPKRRRSLLHRQVATIVGERAEAEGVDADELVGFHLESAYLAMRDVDPQAPGLAELAAEAFARLVAAGRRAHDERDAATAIRLLSRARDLPPRDAPERLRLAPVLADALSLVNEREAAGRVLDEAAEAARPDDEVTRAGLLIARHHVQLWGPGEQASETVLRDIRSAIEVLEAAGDDEGLAYGYIVAFHAAERHGGQRPDPDAYFGPAAAYARAAGSRLLEGVAVSWLCVLVRRGSVPMEDAKRRVREFLDHPPTRWSRAAALGALGTLQAMEGAFDEGRALVAENHAIFEELGHRQTAAADLIAVADIEIIAGDFGAAERLLREGLAELEALGDWFSAVNAAWRLALVLVRMGRDDEAEQYLRQAGEVEAGEYVDIWRLVLGATIAARRGERERAERLLQEADVVAADLPEIGLLADAFIQRAEASELVGRTADAVAFLERAAAIAGRLGYVVAERAARDRLSALRAGT